MDKQAQFRKGDVVLITGVDLYGFNGREAHPGPEHVGLCGEVLESRLVDCSMFPDEPEPPFEFVKVCTFGDDPVILEMVEHEIVKNTISS